MPRAHAEGERGYSVQLSKRYSHLMGVQRQRNNNRSQKEKGREQLGWQGEGKDRKPRKEEAPSTKTYLREAKQHGN